MAKLAGFDDGDDEEAVDDVEYLGG